MRAPVRDGLVYLFGNLASAAVPFALCLAALVTGRTSASGRAATAAQRGATRRGGRTPAAFATIAATSA